MSATLNTFNDLNQIRHANYGLQTQTYTWGPGTLPTGETQIFSLSNWNQGNAVVKAVILEAVAATQAAGVQVYWTADTLLSDRAQGWTSGFPAGMRMYPTRAVAGTNMALYVKNNSGAPIANFQFNYVMTVISLNTFQRLLNGFAYTSDDNANIAAQMKNEGDVVKKIANYFSQGYRPFSMSSMFANLFENRRISNPPDTAPFKLSIPTDATVSTSKSISVTNPGSGPPNFVYILKGISLEGAPAGMTLTIDRDGDTALVNELNAPAWVQADEKPWPFFLPANNHYQITANGNPGDYYVRLDIEQYNASQLLLAHLNMGVDITQVDLGLQ